MEDRFSSLSLPTSFVKKRLAIKPKFCVGSGKAATRASLTRNYGGLSENSFARLLPLVFKITQLGILDARAVSQ